MRSIKMISLVFLTIFVNGCQEGSDQTAPTVSNSNPSQNSESENQSAVNFEIQSSMPEVGTGLVIYGASKKIAVDSSGTRIALLVDGIDNSIIEVNPINGDRLERTSNLKSQSIAISESTSEYILFRFSRWTGHPYNCPKFEADTDALMAVSADSELTSRYISRDYQTWTCFSDKSPQLNTYKDGDGPLFAHEKDVDIEVSQDDTKALVIQETGLSLVDLESGDRFAVDVKDSLNGAQFVDGGVDWSRQSGIVLDSQNRLYRLDFSSTPELTLINSSILPSELSSESWVAIEYHPTRNQYLFLSEQGTLVLSNETEQDIIKLNITLENQLRDGSKVSAANLLYAMDLAEDADKVFIASYSSKSVFSFDLKNNELKLVTYQIMGQ